MSRKNAVGVHILFWLGAVLIVFAIGTPFVSLAPYKVYAQGDFSCGRVAQVLLEGVDVPTYDSGPEPADDYYRAGCADVAHVWISVAVGSAVLGAGLIAGATVWARRVFRDDYQRPGAATLAR